MSPTHLTNDELLQLPTVRNDLTPLEIEALDRLQTALDEIDELTDELDSRLED